MIKRGEYKVEKKDKTIQVRLSNEDFKLLDEKAKKEQRKISTLIREVIKIYTSV